MLRILIMDDKDEKILPIKKVFTQECGIELECIDVAKSLNEGRSYLFKKQYDILLLDLVMPVNEGEQVDATNNYSFIDEFDKVGRLKKPIYIIALSAYEDAITVNAQNYEKRLWKLIHFDLKKEDWKEVLKNAVNAIDSTKTQLQLAIKEETTFDYGVLCALPEEFGQMLKAFGKDKWEGFTIEGLEFSLYKMQLRTVKGNTLRIVSLCCNEPGMQSASVLSSFLISKFELKALFMTGFCAGIKDRGIELGDLFIAESEYDYGSGKLAKNQDGFSFVKPDPKVIPCDYTLKTKINDYLRSDVDVSMFSALKDNNLAFGKNVPSIHFAPGACGSYVIASDDFMSGLLVTNRKMSGLEMEGYGLYVAGHILNKPCLLVKGIADLGDSTKDDKFHTIGSFMSAWFVCNFLRNSY